MIRASINQAGSCRNRGHTLTKIDLFKRVHFTSDRKHYTGNYEDFNSIYYTSVGTRKEPSTGLGLGRLLIPKLFQSFGFIKGLEKEKVKITIC